MDARVKKARMIQESIAQRFKKYLSKSPYVLVGTDSEGYYGRLMIEEHDSKTLSKLGIKNIIKHVVKETGEDNLTVTCRKISKHFNELYYEFEIK